jgi:hypothetical protein
MATWEDYFEMTKQIREDCAIFRGRIIEETIRLEGQIDYIISGYFCIGEKQGELINMIFNTELISFGAKISILQTILMKPENKTFWKKHPKLIEEITTIRKLRNSLAHCRLHHDHEIVLKYDGNILPLYTNINGEITDMTYPVYNHAKAKVEKLKKAEMKNIEAHRQFIRLIHSELLRFNNPNALDIE